MEISVSKFNEVYIRIKCEPSVARELSEFFTFEVPNAKFMPSVRNRLWDGKIRLFSPGTGKIYFGLLPYVKEFLKEQGYKVIYDSDFSKRNLDKSVTTKFVRSLQKKKFKARDYQIDAIHNILESNRGLIVSPTGSGKSFIIYALTRYYIEKLDHQKVLIIVPTTGLVEQMYGDFSDYGWFPDEHCHKLYAGSDKNTSKDVVISTWQSIYKLDKNYFSYSMVVEQLKTEGWQFFGLSGKYEDYPTHQDAYKTFSKSVESIKRKQVEQEFSNGKGETKKKN
mgnify:CR=1 FL=1